MPRVFLAIPITEKTKGKLRQEVDKLKSTLPNWNVRWVAPENLHVTLVFFGWVKDKQIKIIKSEVARSASDFAPFEIITGKLSIKGRPIWLEIERGREELHQLVETLSKKLTIRGSLKEEHDFHPHLTLGRVKKRGRKSLPKITQTFRWRANQLVLYESRLSPKGPGYIPRAYFSLGKDVIFDH